MSDERSEEQKNNSVEKSGEPKDELSITHHTVTIHGQTIPYTVTCGRIILKEEAEKSGEEAGKFEGEKPRASIFFIAYTRDDVEDQASRPLTFSFNGGPGSSSVWLHLGVLGPRRVLMDDEGNPLPPPAKLVDNEYSLLDMTDLVFIDPVSTGFSRVVPGEQAKQFYGFKKDIESVGDFIHLFTSRYARWDSPKFLIGESYGTTRAGGLSGYLQDRHGMYLNGIMLISSVLNFQTIEFVLGNDLPYILFLPTYTATAWYHKRLPADLQKDLKSAIDQSRQFALNEYTLGLMKGAQLGEKKRQSIVKKLSRFTGLSQDYIERSNLRIEIFRFTRELLRDQGRTVGRLDSRFLGYDRDQVNERPEFDPSMAAILGPYSAMLNQYVRAELDFKSDLPYEVLNPKVLPWSYVEDQNRYVNVAETLRKAITTNPYLKVFVGNGYFDLATPFLATEYTFDHIELPAELRANISLEYYESGHMMYIRKAALEKLKSDLAHFIESALP